MAGDRLTAFASSATESLTTHPEAISSFTPRPQGADQGARPGARDDDDTRGAEARAKSEALIRLADKLLCERLPTYPYVLLPP